MERRTTFAARRRVGPLHSGACPQGPSEWGRATLLPPGGAVGGWAAAHLLGAGSFDGRTGHGDEVDVLLCIPRGSRLTSRPGIRLLRADLADDEVVVVDGVPATCGERTAADLARLHPDARERVVALDALWAAGVTTGPAITRYLLRRTRLRGAPLVRAAVALACAGVLSRQETRLRLIWTLDAGLPPPLVNERIVDLEGRHLGRGDLLDVTAGLVGEFDGRDHLDLRVATVDNVRQEGLESAGLVVARYTGLDLLPAQRVRTVFRIRQARERGLARAHEPRGWRVAR